MPNVCLLLMEHLPVAFALNLALMILSMSPLWFAVICYVANDKVSLRVRLFLGFQWSESNNMTKYTQNRISDNRSQNTTLNAIKINIESKCRQKYSQKSVVFQGLDCPKNPLNYQVPQQFLYSLSIVSQQSHGSFSVVSKQSLSNLSVFQQFLSSLSVVPQNSLSNISVVTQFPQQSLVSKQSLSSL